MPLYASSSATSGGSSGVAGTDTCGVEVTFSPGASGDVAFTGAQSGAYRLCVGGASVALVEMITSLNAFADYSLSCALESEHNPEIFQRAHTDTTQARAQLELALEVEIELDGVGGVGVAHSGTQPKRVAHKHSDVLVPCKVDHGQGVAAGAQQLASAIRRGLHASVRTPAVRSGAGSGKDRSPGAGSHAAAECA